MKVDKTTSATVDDALDVFDALDIDGDLPDIDKPDGDKPREENPQQDDADDDEIDTQDLDAEDESDAEDGEDEDEDDDDGGDSQADDEPKAKKQSRSEKRISKLTRDKNDARREAEYWKRIAAENAATPQQVQPTAEQMQAGQSQGMTPEEIQRHVRALATEQVEQERFVSTANTLRTRLIDGGASDSLDRLSNPALTNFEPEAVIALSEAKFPNQVAKAIAGNEALFAKFAALPDGVQRARLIDRLDGRIEGSAAPKKKTVKATPKVRGATRKPEKDPDDMTQGEYEVWAKKQGFL